jgi:hypothetical protein
MKSTQPKKIGSSLWALARNFGSWLSVIVTDNRAMSFVSSRRGRQAERKEINTSDGEQYEEELRLLKSGEESIRQAAQAAAYD